MGLNCSNAESGKILERSLSHVIASEAWERLAEGCHGPALTGKD